METTLEQTIRRKLALVRGPVPLDPCVDKVHVRVDGLADFSLGVRSGASLSWAMEMKRVFEMDEVWFEARSDAGITVHVLGAVLG